MKTTYHLTIKSSNAKTGPIPVSTTSKNSCPKICAFYDKGCYAKSGPLNIHWDKVGADRGISQDDFLSAIAKLPAGQFWRHNQAGDLPNTDGQIDETFLIRLMAANSGKKGFTYTHHAITKGNLLCIKAANIAGFTINLSANNLDHAIELVKHDLPVCTVVKSDETRKHFDYKGKKILVCPATYRDKMSCDKCRLCQKANRNCIVAFPAHGTQKKAVNNLV